LPERIELLLSLHDGIYQTVIPIEYDKLKQTVLTFRRNLPNTAKGRFIAFPDCMKYKNRLKILNFCNYSALKGRFIKAQGSALSTCALSWGVAPGYNNSPRWG